MNRALHQALSAAQLTPRQLAVRVGMTPKQVERWLADETLTPHPRNRADVADALGVDEAMLWPASVRNTIKTGPDREIAAVYPYRSAAPSSLWAQLVRDAGAEIIFAGYTNYFVFLEQPQFAATLRAKAEAGCQVRFLVGDPEAEVTRQREAIEDTPLTVSARIRITLGELARLRDVPGIDVRISAAEDAVNHISLSVFRFDQDALVTPHLARFVGHDSPLMHLRRRDEGGMFDRFSEHAEELWGRGRPV